jgi:hypothetical protein
MRSLRRALLWASVAGFWMACSVNKSGLTDGGGLPDGSAGAGGGAAAGRAGAAGRGGAAGGNLAGSGGSVVGAGGTAGGSAGVNGIAGTNGLAGNGAAGDGAAGTGAGGDSAGRGGNGVAGSMGGGGMGIAGSMGGSGMGGDGAAGTVGTGGNGAAGTGVAGVGGQAPGGRGGAGPGGRGGVSGGGGRGGASGRGGTSGNPCVGYPSGVRSFVAPTDGRVHCYWPRMNQQNWSDAQLSCSIQNGHLVTIQSVEENLFVVSIAIFSGQFADTWIGATDGKSSSDRTGPGTYRWVTNETWSYDNWAQGEPDGFCDQPCPNPNGQPCTCDHRGTMASDGTWIDMWSENSRSSVCEAEP